MSRPADPLGAPTPLPAECTEPPSSFTITTGDPLDDAEAFATDPEDMERLEVEALRRVYERAKSRTPQPSRYAAQPIGAALPNLRPLPETDPEAAAARHDETVRRAEMAERVRICLARANVPERFRASEADPWAPRVPEDCRDEYLRAERALSIAASRPGIYALIGQIGAGKSHMACALVNRFCREGRTARYLDAAEYIQGIRATWRSSESGAEGRFLAEHIRFALLVLDEMTIRRDTPDENLILMRLIKRRDDEKRTTVLIGNYASKREFDESIDARIADRIFQGGGVIFCGWPSLRGRILP